MQKRRQKRWRWGIIINPARDKFKKGPHHEAPFLCLLTPIENILQLFTQALVTLVMKTKTLTIAALATLGLLATSFAEGKKCDKRKGGHKISEEKRAELVAKFDKDGDGKLSEEERKAARAAHKAEFMEKHDTDGDGELSDDEKKAAREARKAKFMEKFDKDGDGELSDEEKKAAREAMGGRRKHGHKGGKRGKGDKKEGADQL